MHILWFRRDLRLSDNEIVTIAAADLKPVLPCFIVDPWFYEQSEVGKARVRFLFESLENLDQNLRQLGSRLYLFEGNSTTVLQDLAKDLLQQGIRPKLFFNRDVQVQYGIERDRAILDFYSQHNLECHLGLSSFLQTKGDRRDEWFNEYYTYQRQPLHVAPSRINTPQLSFNLPQLTFDDLKQKYKKFWLKDSTYFRGGETQALATLDSFLKRR